MSDVSLIQHKKVRFVMTTQISYRQLLTRLSKVVENDNYYQKYYMAALFQAMALDSAIAEHHSDICHGLEVYDCDGKMPNSVAYDKCYDQLSEFGITVTFRGQSYELPFFCEHYMVDLFRSFLDEYTQMVFDDVELACDDKHDN